MIIYRSEKEIGKIKASCQVVARTLKVLEKEVAVGMTTRQLDRVAEDSIRRAGAAPAFKGYRGYPATLCASVNDQVVHGIPNDRPLREGDILSLDLGAILDGYYGDAALTVAVGKVDPRAIRLMEVTRDSLYRGIEQARPGNRVSDVSCTIQDYVESRGYSVVRNFVGHGIGTNLHEDPQVPNFGTRGKGPKIKEGMVLAIEPMVNEGSFEVRILADNWTVETIDHGLSAHFEHSIAVTKDGPVILSELEGE
ncbi:MAG: type I methionyl aminopeptidase [Acidobacteria bacterium]|nr:type I methionyl aminopeptidase [Acidobacteriota bacterium]